MRAGGLLRAAVAVRVVLLDQPPVGVEHHRGRRAVRDAEHAIRVLAHAIKRIVLSVKDYLDELTRQLQARLGDRLLAAWVVGSSALGDFDAARSDVDVQAISSERLTPDELRALATELSAVPCPVRGLEFVLYALEDLTDPLGPAFSLNLNTGPGMDHHEGYHPDAEPRFWFTLDVSIARDHAVPLAGPHPRELLPELPRALVLARLRDSLAWWGDFGGSQAVLAACRALAWSETGRWLSKGEAARWAADPVAEAALAARTDPSAAGPTPGEVASVLDRVGRRLTATSSTT